MKKSKAPSVAWPTVDDPTDIEIAAAIRLCREAQRRPGFVVTWGWCHVKACTQRSFDLAFSLALKASGRGSRFSDADRYAAAEAGLLMMLHGARP